MLKVLSKSMTKKYLLKITYSTYPTIEMHNFRLHVCKSVKQLKKTITYSIEKQCDFILSASIFRL